MSADNFWAASERDVYLGEATDTKISRPCLTTEELTSCSPHPPTQKQMRRSPGELSFSGSKFCRETNGHGAARDPPRPESILTGIFSSVFANECTADLSLLFMQMFSYPPNDCSVIPR
jgi:hypothetical protein